MSISQAVQDAIRSNLPGQVADEMRTFIEKAQATEAELTRHKSELNDVRVRLKVREETLSQHADIDVRERALNDRAGALNSKELELIKKEARLEADVAKAELSGVRTSMSAFLANVTVRRSVIENSQAVIPAQQQPGGYMSPATTMPVNGGSHTTETEE